MKLLILQNVRTSHVHHSVWKVAYWWKYFSTICTAGITWVLSVLVRVLEYYLYYWKYLSIICTGGITWITFCTICCDISSCPLSDNRTSATLLVSFCLRQHYLVTVLLSIYTKKWSTVNIATCLYRMNNNSPVTGFRNSKVCQMFIWCLMWLMVGCGLVEYPLCLRQCLIWLMVNGWWLMVNG